MDNQRSHQDISFAVCEGNLERVRESINSFGLLYSRGYFLLRLALRNKHAAVAKLLLTNGAEINGKTRKPVNTPLHFAVINGDIEMINLILEKGADVEATNQSGHTPLHVAVERDDIEVTTSLLSRGVHVDVKGENGITPLHVAAKNGYIRIAEYLLSCGACIHSSTLTEGYTPLHVASELDNEETVQFFLDRGADVNAKTKDDSTPLHIATKREHEKVVKLLLQHGAKVDNQDENGKTTLPMAAERGNLIIVEEILKCCPDINDLSNKSSLKLAVCGEQKHWKIYEEIFEALLEYGFIVDPENANDSHFLYAAVRKGYLKIVKGLLKYSAIINASDEYGRTALHFTAECVADDNIAGKIAKLLLSKGAHVDARTKNGETALYIAIRRGYVKVVEVLSDYNANVICGGRNDVTPIHLSAGNRNAKITTILLNRGANVNAEQEDGSTALHIAAGKGHKEVVKVLLECGAKVDSEMENGSMALHIAAQEGHGKVVKVLLECGAKVNSKTKNGTTPLHLAAQMGSFSLDLCSVNAFGLECFINFTANAIEMSYMETIKTLLEFGADIHFEDERGRTALYIASGAGHNKIVATLLDHGADINITSRDNDTPLDYTMAEIRALPRQPQQGDNYYWNHAQDYFSSRLEAVVETLERHIVKMKTANLYVSEQNLLLISNNDGISNFQDECERELTSMKSEGIDNANVSFYDILVKNTSSLARYLKNENIVEVLKLDTYKTKFPIYARMIKNNFSESMERKELLERGNGDLRIFFDNLSKLPPECIGRIIDYFSNKELQNLIDTFKPPGINDPYANDVVIP